MLDAVEGFGCGVLADDWKQLDIVRCPSDKSDILL